MGSVSFRSKWRQKEVRYLGIRISDTSQDLLRDNIVSYIHKMRNPLAHGQKLKISWWDRITVVKMKSLSVLLTLFQTLIICMPIKWINKIQDVLNRFLWQNNQVRVKKSMLQQRIQDGGMAFPLSI